MRRIGLTGGIGSGKTTAASWIAGRAIPVVDTDVIAREVVEPGQPALEAIVERFGAGVRRTDGSLDRTALGAIVFGSPSARRDLECILHPLIHGRWMATLDDLAARGHASAVVVVPLLFEKGYEGLFDLVVAVGCSAGTQRARLFDRGWDEAQIEARKAAQWSTEAKMEAANKVLWNEGRLSVLHEQARRALDLA